MPGDQEAGQHEEDVDAYEAAPQEAHACVIEHDEKDRDGSETLDVVTMLEHCIRSISVTGLLCCVVRPRIPLAAHSLNAPRVLPLQGNHFPTGSRSLRWCGPT